MTFRRLFISAICLLPSAFCLAQTKAVLKNPATNGLTEALVVPSGGSITINAGGTITNNGTATGFGAAWGNITGTLSSQTDLQSALDLKAPVASPTFTGTATAQNLVLTGNIGTGYFQANTQSAAPASAASPRLYFDILGAPRLISNSLGDLGIITTGDTGTVTNGMLAGSIAYSKLSLTGAILNADLAGSIDLTSKVTGALPVANGGTGQTTFTNGQLLIGNTTGNTLTKATLTAGTGMTITNSTGSITLGPTIAADSDARTATSASMVVTPANISGYTAVQTLTDGATVAFNVASGCNATVTLGGNRTLGAPTNLRAGASGFIIIKQDGTGSRTLAYNASWKFAGGTAPVLTTTASAVDVLVWFYDGSTLIGTLSKDYK